MGKVTYTSETINHKTIITRSFTGDVVFTDIVDSFSYMVNNKDLKLHEAFGLITDISNCIVDIDISEVEKIAEFISTNDIVSNIYIAVVSEDVDKLLLPTLINLKLGDRLMPFDNVNDARLWILEK